MYQVLLDPGLRWCIEMISSVMPGQTMYESMQFLYDNEQAVQLDDAVAYFFNFFRLI